MRIGLAQVDGKYPNLALMKLSAWHKAQGDRVEWYSPMEAWDRVYASKVFGFTPDHHYLPPDVIRGGSGYDLTTNLPAEAEAAFPDYALYPKMDYAMGFTTRGCIRRCPFCIVPQKEGRLRVVGDLHSFWSGQKRIRLLDNNLTAASMEHFALVIRQLVDNGLTTDFSQGLDIRLLNDEHAALLARVRLWKQIHFAWDNIGDEAAVRTGIAVIRKHMPLSRVMFYVLIGFGSTVEEDLYRVETLRGLGVDPFVMPFNKANEYQRAFARWCNHKAIFRTVPWSQYRGARRGTHPTPAGQAPLPLSVPTGRGVSAAGGIRG